MGIALAKAGPHSSTCTYVHISNDLFGMNRPRITEAIKLNELLHLLAVIPVFLEVLYSPEW